MKLLLNILFFCIFIKIAFAQKHLTAGIIENDINIDGNLSENEWLKAANADSFIQIEPKHGEPALNQTQVKVLCNSNYIYFGGVCHFKNKNEGIRVQNLDRDFDYSESDAIGFVLDLFNDKRNATAFFINPLGAQRDETVFNENIENLNWDIKWYSATRINEYDWTFEIAIPWSSLRYSPNSDSLGINIVRLDRKSNELSAWCPYPRTYSMFRLTYEGILTGIQDPPPHKNISINPYVLINNKTDNVHINGFEIGTSSILKPGGDLKWAINSNTIIDATVNTDFAQADVDKEIINLTEFDISLPEKRKFFLESSGIFSAGNSVGTIEPFFSRRIGIDKNNNPTPMDGGLRLVHTDVKKNYGLLAALTHIPDSLNSLFLVGRYSQNYGAHNRLGLLTTYRRDKFNRGENNNYVGTLDGFIRFNDKLSLTWTASGSLYSLYNDQDFYGYSQSTDITYLTEDIHLYLNNYLISKNCYAESGFTAAKDIAAFETGTDLYLRPDWKPQFIRDFEPAFYINYYRNISTGVLRQFYFTVWPIYFLFQNGMVISLKWLPTWENLYEEFIPSTEVVINKGKYFYNRYESNVTSNPSAALSYSLQYSTGTYFNGHLDKLTSTITYAPIPNISLSFDYQPNWLKGIGNSKINKKIEIISTELKLALNLEMGLTSFYQYNSENKTFFTSIRFSWEYSPLSYLYFLYNFGKSNILPEINPNQNQLLIKLSYQF